MSGSYPNTLEDLPNPADLLEDPYAYFGKQIAMQVVSRRFDVLTAIERAGDNGYSLAALKADFSLQDDVAAKIIIQNLVARRLVQEHEDNGNFVLTDGCWLRCRGLVGYFHLFAALPHTDYIIKVMRGEEEIAAPSFCNVPSDPADPVVASGDAADLFKAMFSRQQYLVLETADFIALRQVTRFLDLGGGAGGDTVAVLQKIPDAWALLLDSNGPAIDEANVNATHYGVADRMEAAVGDMFEVSLQVDGQAPDAMLLANVGHDWGEGTVAELLRRGVEALLPGGYLYYLDQFPDLAADNEAERKTLAGRSAAVYYFTGKKGSLHDYTVIKRLALAAGLIEPDDDKLAWRELPGTSRIICFQKPNP